MKQHYDTADWVDLTRGVAPPERRGEIQDHLAGGCVECREEAEFFNRLTRVCERIGGIPVPAASVRLAKSIFPAREPWPKRVLRLPVELVYDSFLVPAPAGLRSSWQVGWQGLFHAGDCSVDLRIEPELRSSKASVIGQISNHLLPELEMSDIPVYLKAGKQVVAETRSNRFGEFQMEYQQQGRLQLCIYLDGGRKCIQLPLKRLASERSSQERLDRPGDFGPSHDEKR